MKERRYITVQELRVAEDKQIRGYAAVFNETTTIGGQFKEVVKPGAFSRAIKEKQDCRALWNHNPDLVMGRTKAGTLALAEDDKGLHITIEPPNSETAKHWVENIQRGDVDQMSFGFIPIKEIWSKEEDGTDLRELLDLDLFDVSPVTYPAYEGTEVGYRSAEQVITEHREATEHEPEAVNDQPDTAHEPVERQRLELIKLKG